MKDLKNITQEEVETICELLGEPYISHMAGLWNYGLAVQIVTTSTVYNNSDDSYITIFYDGKINLHRNNGNWGGMRDESICSLIITDYLRSEGYEFKYEITKKLERKFKLNELNKISKL